MADTRPRPRLPLRLLTTLSAVFLAAGIALIPTAAFASNGNSDHSQGNAGTSGTYNQPQPTSNADQHNTGANDTSSSNQYASTRSGLPSGNGSGNGQASGKPCAGCVGRADNKNPQGQYPNGNDSNNGYECDGNQGIGQTNPAHTGCVSNPTTPTTQPTSTTTSTTLPKSTTTSTTLPISPTTTPTVPPSVAPGGGTTTVPGGAITPARNAGASSRSAAPAASPSAAVRTSPSGALAFTGNDSTVEALAGVASLGLGLGLLRLARRRRRAAG